MVDLAQKFDVLVIGGGNAALCSAIILINLTEVRFPAGRHDIADVA